MDEDADRDPESPAHIEQRRAQRAELDRQYRERQRELAQNHNGIPETHDDLHNLTNYEVPPLWEILNDTARRIARLRMDDDAPSDGKDAEVFDPLATTIGDIRLMPYYWSPGDSADLTRNLDGQEATRVYLYLDLSPLPEYRVADRLDMARVRNALNIENSVSQSTLNRMPGRMEKERRYYLASETETLVRQWEGTKFEDWVRNPTPDTIAPDGEGVPPIQILARELRSDTFKYIRLKRDTSTSVSKDAAMRVLVAAANGNEFVNDAANNLDLKPWYDGDEVPTGQTLIHHIRKSSREQITRMFMEANEPLFQIADDNDYFPEKVEVAIDITDWPYFGDPDADNYVQGTKAGRNYARAWKYITLSLVGTDTPLILFVLPVKDRSEAPGYVRRLLRVASQFVDLHRVYMDAGTEFYNDETISTVNEFGLELVMQGRKSGKTIKHFLNGMGRIGLESSYYSYGVGFESDEYDTQPILPEKFRDYIFTRYPGLEDGDTRVSPTPVREGDGSLPYALETGEVDTLVATLRDQHRRVTDVARQIQSQVAHYLTLGGVLSYVADSDAIDASDVDTDTYQLLYRNLTATLYQDAPSLESMQTIADLERLCALAAHNRGRDPIRFQRLVELFDVDRRTIRDSYLDILEKLFVLTSVTEYDNQRPRATRLYLRDTGLVSAVENKGPRAALNDLDYETDLARIAAFDHTMRLAYGVNAAQGNPEAPSVQYWRGRSGEVDYVFEVGDTPVPIALAYRSSTREAKYDALREFRDQYQTPVGLLVSGDTSSRLDPVMQRDDGVIELPYWLYLLLS